MDGRLFLLLCFAPLVAPWEDSAFAKMLIHKAMHKDIDHEVEPWQLAKLGDFMKLLKMKKMMGGQGQQMGHGGFSDWFSNFHAHHNVHDDIHDTFSDIFHDNVHHDFHHDVHHDFLDDAHHDFHHDVHHDVLDNVHHDFHGDAHHDFHDTFHGPWNKPAQFFWMKLHAMKHAKEAEALQTFKEEQAKKEMEKFKQWLEHKEEMKQHFEHFSSFMAAMKAHEEHKKEMMKWQAIFKLHVQAKKEAEFGELMTSFAEKKKQYVFTIIFELMKFCKCRDSIGDFQRFMAPEGHHFMNGTAMMDLDGDMFSFPKTPQEAKKMFLKGLVKTLCGSAKLYVKHVKDIAAHHLAHHFFDAMHGMMGSGDMFGGDMMGGAMDGVTGDGTGTGDGTRGGVDDGNNGNGGNGNGNGGGSGSQTPNF